MSEQAAPPGRDDYPPSPCTRVCTLDDQDICLGCGRTLDEIVGWAGMTADEQRAVIAALASRSR